MTISIIPARKGSKSVPGKNLKKIKGKPLIVYSIEASLAAQEIEKTVVTTDGDDIAAIAADHGAEVIKRPDCISEDHSLDYQFMLHALMAYEEDHPNTIVQLRPTYPFRDPTIIDKAVALFRACKHVDSLKSVSIASQTPFKMWKAVEDPNGVYNTHLLKPVIEVPGLPEAYNRPRQSLPIIYWQNGYVDITRWDTIMKQGSMTGERIMPFVIDDPYPVDIDYMHNFAEAERIAGGEGIALPKQRWPS
jgi:CMP-N,N'-diacetyllegionaminic acid synthase